MLKALALRLQGRQASRPRAFATAAVAGVGAAVVVYRLLRSGGENGALESAGLPFAD